MSRENCFPKDSTWSRQLKSFPGQKQVPFDIIAAEMNPSLQTATK